MNTAKQLNFEGMGRSVKYFGGAYLKNSNPKSKRPLSFKRSMHLVLRSSLAKGPRSLLRKELLIKDLIFKQGKHLGVKVYRQAVVGNHIHLLVRPLSRDAFNNFVRSISGLIARNILRAERGAAKGLKFWDKRPFTQVVEWGRQYGTVCNYLLQNSLEAWGFIAYTPRKNELIGFHSTA